MELGVLAVEAAVMFVIAVFAFRRIRAWRSTLTNWQAAGSVRLRFFSPDKKPTQEKRNADDD